MYSRNSPCSAHRTMTKGAEEKRELGGGRRILTQNILIFFLFFFECLFYRDSLFRPIIQLSHKHSFFIDPDREKTFPILRIRERKALP